MTDHFSKILTLKKHGANAAFSNYINTLNGLRALHSTPPTPPASGTPIKMIGGKTVAFNQLASLTSSDWLKKSASLSISNKTLTITSTSTSTSSTKFIYLTLIRKHKYFVRAIVTTPASVYATIGMYKSSTSSTEYNSRVQINPSTTETVESIFETDNTYYTFRISHAASSGNGKSFTAENVQIFDLTRMFGSGNEPTIAEFKLLFSNTYYDYSTGSLLSGKCDSVISYDDQSTQIDEYLIPAEIQSIDTYGISTHSTYNYVDFENKKFKKYVNKVDLGSLSYTRAESASTGVYYFKSEIISDLKHFDNSSIGNIITSIYNLATYASIANGTNASIDGIGTVYYTSGNMGIDIRDDSCSTSEELQQKLLGIYLYYEMSTPVETDISSYVSTIPTIETAEGGSIVLHQQNDTKLDIPYIISDE